MRTRLNSIRHKPMQKPSIGVAVLTLQAEKHLKKCLQPIIESSLKPKILVVDSSSTDNTVKLAKELDVQVEIIPRAEFNHGLTREKARKILGTDIVVMMTQDAYPVDRQMLELLVKPLINGDAAVSYARQIAHDDADIFESFPREFNYPAQSHIRSIEDKETYGAYTFFCSNSCAAYCNAALDKIGGFQHVLFGEDTLAVAQLMQKGEKVAYVAEAVVKHSHSYTLMQEFRRNFDIGLFRREYESIFKVAGKAECRGIQFFRKLRKALSKEFPVLIPYAYIQTGFKWLGYRLGRASYGAPTWWKRSFSSQSFYWKN